MTPNRPTADVSQAALVKLLKWPIVFALIFTSFPAGFAPCMAFGAYEELWHEQHASTKWRNRAKIESSRQMLHLFIALSAAAWAVQGGLTWACCRNLNGFFLGFRSTGWLAMIWGTFVVGVALGIWIVSMAPV
ncbi:MAG: hypothetical protein ABSH08_01915 [Tepidisphaeraceae bacterium]